MFVNDRVPSHTITLSASALVLFVATLLVVAPQAKADATITYYTISSSNPDANQLSSGVFDNEVQQLLGVNGLPILNTNTFGCVSNCFTATGPGGVNLTSDGEITYWSPTLNPYVTFTGSQNITLPFSVGSDFFAPNGTGSSDGGTNGYQAAVITATLNAGSTEQLSFNIGADDMAFAYLDGQVVCDLGGVHAATTGTCTTATVAAGNHELKVFFVDINEVQSGFTFGVNTQDVIVTPPTTTPEPATLTLLGLGVLALAGSKRKAR